MEHDNGIGREKGMWKTVVFEEIISNFHARTTTVGGTKDQLVWLSEANFKSQTTPRNVHDS